MAKQSGRQRGNGANGNGENETSAAQAAYQRHGNGGVAMASAVAREIEKYRNGIESEKRQRWRRNGRHVKSSGEMSAK
jgi:hypothetical protein